ncbi:MAG: hypothetical protein ABSF00_06865 [Candidatus Bathyarchaeia archaeon]
MALASVRIPLPPRTRRSQHLHTRHAVDPNPEHKPEIPIPRKYADHTLEVHDGIVSRLIEQRERLKGNESCPRCGLYNLELKVLLDEIDKLSKLQNEASKKRINHMRKSDEALS